MRPAILFIARPYVPGKPYVRFLRGAEQRAASDKTLFKELPADYALTGFRVTDSIEEADFVVVPQGVRRLDRGMTEYLESVKKSATQAGKRVIVFLAGDTSDQIHIEGVTVFCASTFRSSKRPNEIVSPSFIDAHVVESPFLPREKKEKPRVSFCGYAGFPRVTTRLAYYGKNLALDLAALSTGNQQLLAHKRGIYWRRKAMKLLRGDSRFETNFIVRDSFSGNSATIAGSAERTQQEFIESIVTSDFVLAPRGDGNYSARFFEALALGRIPVLIDTDVALPLEEVIDYDKIIVRVPYTDLAHIGDYVEKYYNALSPEEWVQRQEFARETFQKYLRYDAFINHVFSHLV